MKILIVGGLGYIGGRLASNFRKNSKAEIFLTTRRNQRHFPKWADEFQIYKMDMLDEASVRRCFDAVKPDTVVHLGAIDRVTCMKDPDEAIAVNVGGTKKLIHQAHENGIRKFIYFSTFHVYGDLIGNITEAHTLSPAHLYAESKLKAEEFVRAFSVKGMRTLIFRVSNGYGYPMDHFVGEHVWTLAFNVFCKEAIADGKITIRSNQYRNFIALEDIAHAVHYFLFTIPDQWGDGIFNLGGERCILIKEVAEEISRVYEKHYNRGPLKIEMPVEEKSIWLEAFRFNIEKLKQTGFRLTGNMETEILGTMRLCEHRMKENF